MVSIVWKYDRLGVVKLAKKTHSNNHGYIGYGYWLWVDADLDFSINGELGKNFIIVIIVDNSLSVHTDNRKKDILALVEDSA